MKTSQSIDRDAQRLRKYSLALLVVWTIVVAVSGAWNLYEIRREAIDGARITARAAHFKDVIYRRWSADQGGVYVQISDRLRPNEYLSVPHRDIETVNGRKLTLVNPAFMTRMAHEIQESVEGVKGHITSLNPIRPGNVPDTWETEALKSLEKGNSEFSSVETLGGKPYLRLMRPLVTEKGCLNCHAVQGYKEGDIRGGISVAVPMETLLSGAHKHVLASVAGHAGLWFLGVLGIVYGSRRLSQSISERNRALGELRESNSIIMESIEYARTIQEAMLPGRDELGRLVPDHFVLWMPRDVIGGDFFWCDSNEDGFSVAVGDCTGHGVPGAFMTAIACTTLNRVANEFGLSDPSRMLSELNRLMKLVLNQHAPTLKSDDGLDIALCYVDTKNRKLVFSGAGAALYYSDAGGAVRLRGDRQSIGYRSSPLDCTYTTQVIELKSETTFYMTTDGLIHQIGQDKKLPFGIKRFMQFIEQNRTQDLKTQGISLEKEFNEFKGDSFQRDDVTVLGFRITSSSS